MVTRIDLDCSMYLKRLSCKEVISLLKLYNFIEIKNVNKDSTVYKVLRCGFY